MSIERAHETHTKKLNISQDYPIDRKSIKIAMRRLGKNRPAPGASMILYDIFCSFYPNDIRHIPNSFENHGLGAENSRNSLSVDSGRERKIMSHSLFALSYNDLNDFWDSFESDRQRAA